MRRTQSPRSSLRASAKNKANKNEEASSSPSRASALLRSMKQQRERFQEKVSRASATTRVASSPHGSPKNNEEAVAEKGCSGSPKHQQRRKTVTHSRKKGGDNEASSAPLLLATLPRSPSSSLPPLSLLLDQLQQVLDQGQRGLWELRNLEQEQQRNGDQQHHTIPEEETITTMTGESTSQACSSTTATSAATSAPPSSNGDRAATKNASMDMESETSLDLAKDWAVVQEQVVPSLRVDASTSASPMDRVATTTMTTGVAPEQQYRSLLGALQAAAGDLLEAWDVAHGATTTHYYLGGGDDDVSSPLSSSFSSSSSWSPPRATSTARRVFFQDLNHHEEEEGGDDTQRQQTSSKGRDDGFPLVEQQEEAMSLASSSGWESRDSFSSHSSSSPRAKQREDDLLFLRQGGGGGASPRKDVAAKCNDAESRNTNQDNQKPRREWRQPNNVQQQQQQQKPREPVSRQNDGSLKKGDPPSKTKQQKESSTSSLLGAWAAEGDDEPTESMTHSYSDFSTSYSSLRSLPMAAPLGYDQEEDAIQEEAYCDTLHGSSPITIPVAGDTGSVAVGDARHKQAEAELQEARQTLIKVERAAANLREENVQLLSRVAKVTVQENAARRERDDAMARLAEVQSELQGAAQASEDRQVRVDKLAAEVVSKTRRLKKADFERQESLKQIYALEDQVQALELTKADLLARVEALEKAVQEDAAKLEVLARVAPNGRVTQSNLNSILSEIAAAKSELVTIRSEREAAEAELDHVTVLLDDTQSEVARLESETARLEVCVESGEAVKQELALALNRIQALEKESLENEATLDDRVEEFKKQASKSEALLSNLSEATERLALRAASLEEQNASAMAVQADLTRERDEALHRLRQLEKESPESEIALQIVKKELQEATERVDSLQASLEEQAKSAAAERDRLTLARDEALNRVQELEKDASALKNNVRKTLRLDTQAKSAAALQVELTLARDEALKRVQELEKKTAENDGLLNSLYIDLRDTTERLGSTRKNLDEQAKSAATEKDEMTFARDNATSRIQELEEKTSKYKTKLRETRKYLRRSLNLASQAKSATAEKEDLALARDYAMNRLEELENDLRASMKGGAFYPTMNPDLRSSSKQLLQMEEKVRSLEAEAAFNSKLLLQGHDEMESLENKAAALKLANSHLKTQLCSLRDENDAAIEQVDTIKADKIHLEYKLSSQLARVKEANDGLRTSHGSAQTQLFLVQSERDEAQKHLREANSALTQSHSAENALRSKIKELQSSMRTKPRPSRRHSGSERALAQQQDEMGEKLQGLKKSGNAATARVKELEAQLKANSGLLREATQKIYLMESETGYQSNLLLEALDEMETLEHSIKAREKYNEYLTSVVDDLCSHHDNTTVQVKSLEVERIQLDEAREDSDDLQDVMDSFRAELVSAHSDGAADGIEQSSLKEAEKSLAGSHCLLSNVDECGQQSAQSAPANKDPPPTTSDRGDAMNDIVALSHRNSSRRSKSLPVSERDASFRHNKSLRVSKRDSRKQLRKSSAFAAARATQFKKSMELDTIHDDDKEEEEPVSALEPKGHSMGPTDDIVRQGLIELQADNTASKAQTGELAKKNRKTTSEGRERSRRIEDKTAELESLFGSCVQSLKADTADVKAQILTMLSSADTDSDRLKKLQAEKKKLRSCEKELKELETLSEERTALFDDEMWQLGIAMSGAQRQWELQTSQTEALGKKVRRVSFKADTNQKDLDKLRSSSAALEMRKRELEKSSESLAARSRDVGGMVDVKSTELENRLRSFQRKFELRKLKKKGNGESAQ